MRYPSQEFYEKMAVGERDAANKKLGRKGEKLAVKYLKRGGYKILKRNYVNPFGEVDIIAQKEDTVAFIEVKTRLSDVFGAPSEAVNYSRKQRYISAAKYFFYERAIDCTVRFDIIEIFKGTINHIENAFY